MDIGIVGMGRMGAGIARRLHRSGHRVVVTNRTYAKVEPLLADGLTGVRTRAEVIAALPQPRVVLVMVTAGEGTDSVFTGDDGVLPLLTAGDIVIDGGNSPFGASIARAAACAALGLHFVDQGTSGGVLGEERGYCVMVGGEAEAVARLAPLYDDLAMTGGWVHAGPSGAGHYTKMVHNAIEYGMMQSLAEGVALLTDGPYPGTALPELLSTWQHGSIISSFLLDILGQATVADARLAGRGSYVADSGEGQWAIETALAHKIPVPAITAALFARYATQQEPGIAARSLAAMRMGFGQHPDAKG